MEVTRLLKWRALPILLCFRQWECQIYYSLECMYGLVIMNETYILSSLSNLDCDRVYKIQGQKSISKSKYIIVFQQIKVETSVGLLIDLPVPLFRVILTGKSIPYD